MLQVLVKFISWRCVQCRSQFLRELSLAERFADKVHLRIDHTVKNQGLFSVT